MLDLIISRDDCRRYTKTSHTSRQVGSLYKDEGRLASEPVIQGMQIYITNAKQLLHGAMLGNTFPVAPAECEYGQPFLSLNPLSTSPNHKAVDLRGSKMEEYSFPFVPVIL